VVTMNAGVTAGQIHGYYETIAALRALDKNAARRIDAGINKAAKVVAEDAKDLVDNDILSGFAKQMPGGTKGNRRQAYGGGYDDALVKAGIRVRRKKQKKRGNELRSFVVIANETALGAIWEVAGRTSSGKTPAGMAMIRNISARDPGPVSRTVWRAMDANRDTVQKQIDDQIAEARRLCQRQIDRA
jgi:hypothetical protein